MLDRVLIVLSPGVRNGKRRFIPEQGKGLVSSEHGVPLRKMGDPSLLPDMT